MNNNKNYGVFEQSFFEGRTSQKRTTIGLILALVLHLSIGLYLVVAPLLTTGELPEIEVVSAFLVPPSPPPPSPPPPAAKKRSERSARIKPVQAQTNIETGRLVAPVEIPDEISEEQLSDIGIEGGIPEGVEGGVPGGILGGVVGGILGDIIGDIAPPVRALGEIRPPKLIREVAPIYPEIARQARIEGIVIIEATTDIYGRVTSWQILRSIPLLDQAAIDAVRQWVYEPMVINGKPRGVIFTVTVRFQLRD